MGLHLPPPRELFNLEIGVDSGNLALTTSPSDIPSLTGSFTAGALPFIVEADLPRIQRISASNFNLWAYITDQSGNIIRYRGGWFGATGGEGAYTVKARFDPSPGAKSYKVRLSASASVTVNLIASVVSNVAQSPYTLRAYEVAI